ncbi:MAG: DEAD/DEAH box helicase, partial [Clostridia bacterium]|nr:DEAD/DEAH box helicase [Clostridia bacterium]
MQKLPSLDRLKKSIVNIEVGKMYNLTTLVSTLQTMGYVRQDMVSASGEFSLRGDILDIFLTNFSSPVRISFFDDEVEKINTFNVNSYSVGEVFSSIEILPSTLALIDNEEKENVIKTIKNSLLKSNFKDETMLRLNDICSFQIESLESNLSSVSSVFFLPICDFFNSTIIDYFSEENIIFFNEPRRILDLLDVFYKEFYESWQSLYSKGEYLIEHKQFYIEKTKIFNTLKQKRAASFNRTFESNNIFESENSLNVRTIPSQKYFTDFNELIKDVINFHNDNKTIILSCATPLTINKIGNLLAVAKLEYEQIDNIFDVTKKGIYITEQNIPSSVLLFDLDLLIIGSNSLNQNPVSVIKVERKEKPTFLPQVGDFVVHQVHGVGKCVKIEKLKLSSSYRDYFVLEYSGGDILYVPTENVDILSSFVGESNPKCNKIGGVEFYKTKQKVKAAIKQMAFDLIKVYSYRQNNKGFRYSKDTYLQTAFEDAFEFEHTQDQIQAIKDIKYDMESGKIMERLVCGDVGYGKTEVALVAAYKAIQDGKQVAIICPTTILSQQHYNTAISRMKDFGVNV